jgi:hypothetical protein
MTKFESNPETEKLEEDTITSSFGFRAYFDIRILAAK